MNKYYLRLTMTLILLLCRINVVFSQEWEVNVETTNVDTSQFKFSDVLELSNSNYLVSSRLSYRSGVGDFYSNHPATMLLSSNGTILDKEEYFRPGLYSSSSFVFENNDDLYMLTTYNPDHDTTYFNYFQNYDNPPTDAVLGLYKINENLSISESYEHIFPIDVYEERDKIEWQISPNEYSGNLFLFSAFEDEGNITGAYFKMVSVADEPRGHDTLFFFKMDFKGNFLLRKGYEMHTTGGPVQYAYRKNQIVRTDNGYIFYTRGFSSDYHGTVEYYDNNFNRIDTRYIIQPNPHDFFSASMMADISVIRSNHNTTYVSTTTETSKDYKDDIRLYEFNDDLDDSFDVLPILHCIERATPDFDRPAPGGGVDITIDDNIFFAYTLNIGFFCNDSWIMIELLDTNFDIISTFFYDEKEKYDQVLSIKTTSDNGIVIVSSSFCLDNVNHEWYKITKFPASAFVTIEEAHANNLHLAVAYPNPGGDVMNIRTSLRNCTLQVYDMQGRMVHQQEITDDVTSVDASSWKSGTYVWELKIENGKLKVEEGKWVK